MKSTEIVELVEELTKNAEEFKELANAFADIAPQFGPALYKVMEPLAIGVTKLFIAQFNCYIENGFSREEAITLIKTYKHQLGEQLEKRR